MENRNKLIFIFSGFTGKKLTIFSAAADAEDGSLPAESRDPSSCSIAMFASLAIDWITIL